VHIDCGEETVGPKTKGYSATVLCLILLCLELGKARGQADKTVYEKAYSLLGNAFSMAEGNIAASVKWAKLHTESFVKAPHMMIVSEGANYPAMLEGALKVLECLYIPVTAYEFEEYLHGVQCSIDENSYIIFVIPDGPNRDRMLRLYRFHAEHQGKGFAVAVNKSAGIENELLIKTAGDDMASVFSVVLPLQVVSAVVSEAKGINCDNSKFPEFVKTLGTKNW
jgi:glucoselysine-6-phosphate deglycase